MSRAKRPLPPPTDRRAQAGFWAWMLLPTFIVLFSIGVKACQ